MAIDFNANPLENKPQYTSKDVTVSDKEKGIVVFGDGIKIKNDNIAEQLVSKNIDDQGLGLTFNSTAKSAAPHQVQQVAKSYDTATPKGNAKDLATNLEKIKKENGYIPSKSNQFGDENEVFRKKMEMEFSGEFTKADSQLTFTLMKQNRGNFNLMDAVEALNFVKQNTGKNINLSNNDVYKNFNENQQKYVQQAIKEISGNDAISDKDFVINPKEEYKIFSQYAELFE